MARKRTIVCSGCESPFEYAGRGSPKRCLRCRKPANRRRSRDRAEARGDVRTLEACERFEGRAPRDLDPDLDRALDPERLAVCLAAGMTDEEALAVVGG